MNSQHTAKIINKGATTPARCCLRMHAAYEEACKRTTTTFCSGKEKRPRNEWQREHEGVGRDGWVSASSFCSPRALAIYARSIQTTYCTTSPSLITQQTIHPLFPVTQPSTLNAKHGKTDSTTGGGSIQYCSSAPPYHAKRHCTTKAHPPLLARYFGCLGAQRTEPNHTKTVGSRRPIDPMDD